MQRENDWVSAPKDYEELVRWYKPYLINFLGQQGIVEGEREDVFMSILEKAMIKDVLAQFDPTRTFDYGGKQHQANFKGFITSFFKSYIPGWLVRQTNRAKREALICDAPLNSGNAEAGYGGDTWVSLNGPVESDFVEDVIAEAATNGFREYLRELPVKSTGDKLDMLAFFDYRLSQVQSNGKVSNRDVEVYFGRSHTCVNSWTWRLRQEFCNWSGMALPAKKPCPPR